MRQVVIPYAPRRVFLPFHERSQRFAIGVAHRRCGKTVAAINDKIKRAITSNKEMYRAAYIAPFLKQAKDVAWEYLKKYSQPLWSKPPNESELYVELVAGQRIKIHGADNPDALRGAYLDDATLDEYADMHPGIWGSVLRPMLADRMGSATFIGTPKGRNAFYDLYERALSDPEWFPFFLPASETGIIEATELEAARKDMTPEQYAQEFECSFEAAILGAYYGKEVADAERAGRIGVVEVDPHVPVQTAWDLGLNDSTSIWFFQVVGPEVHIVDFYENHGEQLPHYAKVIRSKGYRYGEHWFPHDVKATVIGMDRTRVETLISEGIRPRIVTDHKVMDGINAGRVLFSRLYFDADRCKDGLEALRQYRAEYDDKKHTFKDHPRHDWASHAADAFRYLAMAWRELKGDTKPAPKPVLGIRDMTWDQMMKAQAPARKRI